MRTLEINGTKYVALEDLEKRESKAESKANYYKNAYYNMMRFFCPFDEDLNKYGNADRVQVFYHNIRCGKNEGLIKDKSRADYELIIKEQKDQIAGLKSQISRMKKINAEALPQNKIDALKKTRDLLNDILQD